MLLTHHLHHAPPSIYPAVLSSSHPSHFPHAQRTDYIPTPLNLSSSRIDDVHWARRRISLLKDFALAGGKTQVNHRKNRSKRLDSGNLLRDKQPVTNLFGLLVRSYE